MQTLEYNLSAYGFAFSISDNENAKERTVLGPYNLSFSLSTSHEI